MRDPGRWLVGIRSGMNLCEVKVIKDRIFGNQDGATTELTNLQQHVYSADGDDNRSVRNALKAQTTDHPSTSAIQFQLPSSPHPASLFYLGEP